MTALPVAPRLLIFDLDGTLIDSQDAIARSFNRALSAIGGEPPVAPELVFEMIGLPLALMFDRALPLPDEAVVQACIAAYRLDHFEVEIPLLRPFAGVVETLADCRAAGRTLTIATSKIQEVAELAVDAAGLRQYFALVLGGDSVAQHKPHPALVLQTLARFGVPPEEALVIGDSSYDMLMAVAAGVAACGVTYGAQDAAALRAAGADVLIESLPELLPLVGIHEVVLD